MTTTISNATLTVTITETVTLNGTDQGATNTLTVANVDEIYKRILTCPASNTTTIATFNSDAHGAANAIDIEDSKYIRVTNKDDTNAVELAIVGATLYQVTLAA